MIEHGDLWVDYDIEWRIGEPVRFAGELGRIAGGGNVPYRVLVDVEGRGVMSARLDELEAVR